MIRPQMRQNGGRLRSMYPQTHMQMNRNCFRRLIACSRISMSSFGWAVPSTMICGDDCRYSSNALYLRDSLLNSSRTEAARAASCVKATAENVYRRSSRGCFLAEASIFFALWCIEGTLMVFWSNVKWFFTFLFYFEDSWGEHPTPGISKPRGRGCQPKAH